MSFSHACITLSRSRGAGNPRAAARRAAHAGRGGGCTPRRPHPALPGLAGGGTLVYPLIRLRNRRAAAERPPGRRRRLPVPATRGASRTTIPSRGARPR